MKNPSSELLNSIGRDRTVRQSITRESHLFFFLVYFPHYVKYEVAPFQEDIFELTQDTSKKLVCVVAFRGSAKSTIVTFSYTLWAILGRQNRKYVLIVCQTRAQAKQHMMNIRHELENNALLRSDMGPFREENDTEWASSSLVFENVGARITIASLEQSVRGFKHNQYRPDLIILDDIEDLNSTKTFEARNKTFEWFSREIVPLGDMDTRIILVGNLLHEDSLMMRLRKKIEKGDMDGMFKWYPLVDDEGACLWPGKFDRPEKIEALRRSVANELAWQQEYLLHIISDSTRVIFPEWIQYYDELPKNIENDARGIFIGVDLAISQKETADYTAIVTGVLHGEGESLKMYILPNPVNKRMPYAYTMDMIHEIAKKLPYNIEPLVVIETNGFQEIYANQLAGTGVQVEGVKNTTDKRSRLAMTSHYIQTGTIQFPRQGAEELINQLVGFGIEGHDDLSDAFAMAVIRSLANISDDRDFDVWKDMVKENGGAWF
jgi:predicted phage terminase large subunit-like protein